MRITADEVRATAALARLALGDGEVERLTRELGAILGFMDQLAAVDVTGVEPLTHAVTLDCPRRPDQVGPQLAVDEALGSAAEREGDFFLVPRIVAHDKEA